LQARGRNLEEAVKPSAAPAIRCHDMHEIALVQFEPAQIARLRAWLEFEHVRRWFPNADEVSQWASAVPQNGRQRLILSGNETIGYLRWTYVGRETLDSLGFEDLPSNSADLDLFIADEALTGRGIGRRALELALAEMRSERIAPCAALTTSVMNANARRAFERAGFRIDRIYTPEGFGPCYLMLRLL